MSTPQNQATRITRLKDKKALKPPPSTPTTEEIKLPDPMSPDALSKHIALLAKKIDAVFSNGNKSVTGDDKEEIRQLTKKIIVASKHINSVMKEQTIISNITATDLLSSVTEEFRKVIATEQTYNTYASMASKPSKKIRTPLSRPAIIVSATDETLTQSDVINTWHKKLSFKDASFAPARIQQVSNNKVRVEFDNTTQRNETVSKLNNVKDLKFEDAKRRRPMMIIKGINKVVDSKEIVDLIQRQNPSVGTLVSPDKDARLCFLRNNNRSDKLYNAIIEVTPKIRIELLTLGRVNIDHQRVHVSDFSPFLQCYKCLQFGHTKTKCTSTIEPCSHCASTEHTFKQCPDAKDANGAEDTSKLKCYNCHQHNVKTQSSDNDAHSATSMRHCPRIKAMKKRITERVDYGH